MADMTIILPYDRVSPLHIPTRDLVLSSADSLDLTVTIVESDDPSAQVLTNLLTAGGPGCSLIVWIDRHNHPWWDYGAAAFTCPSGPPLWTGVGTLSEAVGSFDIFVPAGTMQSWPPRCNWAVKLDWDTGNQAEMIAQGHLHVRHVPGVAAAGIGVAPPTPPPIGPTVGPIVTVPFVLDLSQLDMGAELTADTGGIGGQPGGVGVGVFIMDDSRLDMGVRI